MAVVQISKIQIRRGLKNSGIGVPQLSSAEMAWAVDTQELFIGNGSLVEGAPFVGNTKILTEFDNILELASSYRFTDSPQTATIIRSEPRSLLSKLDEYVSILDFGAVPDGSTGCAEQFENAFEDLFRNADDKFKKVLLIPNGTYLLERDIQIPSWARIRGETKEGAILLLQGQTISFITEDGKALSEFTSVNRPYNIEISNLTIDRSIGQVDLTGVRDSKFDNVLFKGEYILGEISESIVVRDSAVVWQNSLVGLRTTDILFKECDFTQVATAVKCTQSQTFSSNINFKSCKFFVNDISIYLSGIPSLDNDWKFKDCVFDQIATHVFQGTNARGILFHESQFKNCGNGTNLPSSPIHEIIDFGSSYNNKVIDCFSDRHQAAAITSVATTIGRPEVTAGSVVRFLDVQYADIVPTDSARPLMVFSAFTRCTYIEYVLSMTGGFNRTGRLTITIDDNISSVAITDEYQYSPTLTTSPGGALMTNFEFTAELRENDSEISGVDTLLISYRNPLATGSSGLISYQIRYGV